MSDPDLTGVSPERRSEVRRRIAVIEEYLAIPNPTHAHDSNFAALLNMGAPSFLRLVRIWSETRKPSALPGARIVRTRRASQPGIRNRIRPEVQEIIESVIGQESPQARPVDVQRLVAERSMAASLPTPTLKTTTDFLMRARASMRPHELVSDSEPRVTIDHCALYLPVRNDRGELQLPVLTAVFDALGVIHGHELALTAPSPQVTAMALIKSLQTGSTDRVPLLMNRDYTPGWKMLVGQLALCGVDVRGRTAAPVPSSRAMRATFGDAIGDVKLRPIYTSRPEDGRVPPFKPPSAPLSLADAKAAMTGVIARSNAERGGEGNRPQFVGPDMVDRLRSLLERRIQEPVEPARHRPR